MAVNNATAGRWTAPPRFVLKEPARVKWEKLTYIKQYIRMFDGGFWVTYPCLTVREFTPDTKIIMVRWCNGFEILDNGTRRYCYVYMAEK